MDDRQVLFVESDDFKAVHIVVCEDEDWDVACCGEVVPWDFIQTYKREGRNPTEPVAVAMLCSDCVSGLALLVKREQRYAAR